MAEEADTEDAPAAASEEEVAVVAAEVESTLEEGGGPEGSSEAIRTVRVAIRRRGLNWAALEWRTEGRREVLLHRDWPPLAILRVASKPIK